MDNNNIDWGSIAKIASQFLGNQGGNNHSPSNTPPSERSYRDFGYEARDIRPRKKPIDNPNTCYKSKVVLGLDNPSSTFYSTLRIWAIRPTPEFPQFTVRIGFSNPSSNTYHTITTSELGTLFTFIEKCYKELIVLEEKLKPLEDKCKQVQYERDTRYKDILDDHATDVAKIIENNQEVLSD